MPLRTYSINRDSVNAQEGTFDAVLFTDGEASDGHILNIAGGRVPKRMPLFVNHFPDPIEQLGSLEHIETTDHEVVVRGHIMTEGEGAAAEIRRDLLAKIDAGHVSSMSGRWDAEDEDVTARKDLPKEHPAHVGPNAKGRKRFGLFFDKWKAMEGSIVGLGADPKAVMRWAEDEEAPESVRSFWRGQIDEERVEETSRPDPADFADQDSFLEACVPQVVNEGKSQDEAVAQCINMWESRKRDVEEVEPEETPVEVKEADPPVPDAQVEPPTRESRLEAFRAYVREMHSLGLTSEELIEVLEEEQADPLVIALLGRMERLEKAIEQRLTAPEERTVVREEAEASAPDEGSSEETGPESNEPTPVQRAAAEGRELLRRREKNREERSLVRQLAETLPKRDAALCDRISRRLDQRLRELTGRKG